MFWKKKLPKTKLSDFTFLENKILQWVVENIDTKYAELVRTQINLLTHKKRIDYKESFVVELYPDSFNSIPDNTLFGRREEFLFATLDFNIDGKKYNAQLFAVLGAIFDIKIKPKPPANISEMHNIELIRIELCSNMHKNIW